MNSKNIFWITTEALTDVDGDKFIRLSVGPVPTKSGGLNIDLEPFVARQLAIELIAGAGNGSTEEEREGDGVPF